LPPAVAEEVERKQPGGTEQLQSMVSLLSLVQTVEPCLLVVPL
jgi:hypothetical protein